MKICFVSYAPNPTTKIRGYGFAKCFENRGFEARVLKYWETLPKETMPSLPRVPMLLGRFASLVERILAYNPHVIYVLGSFPPHAIAAIVTHNLLKNKLIFDIDDWEFKENAQLNKLIAYCQNYLTARSRVTIASSNMLTKYVSALGASKVHYIPTGTDVDLFNPKKFTKTKHDRKILIFTGARTREYWDNILIMLKALEAVVKENKNFELLMVGKGEAQVDKKIESFVKARLGRYIRLAGEVPWEELPDVLANADIALHPLADNFFNMCKSPTKLFEYMAMELPVVSSSVGEANLIIDHGKNGLLSKNTDEFANSILTLLDDKKLAKRVGNSARETVGQKYSLKVLGERLAKVLEQI
jgi:glycosyltransferase involved in cell wall biosynthesis